MLKLKGAKSLQTSTFFPFSSKEKLGYGRYFAFVGLGSNINDEKKRFDRLFRFLINDKRIRVLQSSSLLINKAFGFEAQKDFTNAVILVQTPLHAKALLKILLYYEFKFKRKRTFKNAPRTLDLDLLYFSQKVGANERCVVPHVGVKERLSVILPLGELNERRVCGTTHSYFYR